VKGLEVGGLKDSEVYLPGGSGIVHGIVFVEENWPVSSRGYFVIELL
jgi:hypothetical protein